MEEPQSCVHQGSSLQGQRDLIQENKQNPKPSTKPKRNAHERLSHRFRGLPVGAAILSSLRAPWSQALAHAMSHQDSHNRFSSEAGSVSQELEILVPEQSTDMWPESDTCSRTSRPGGKFCFPCAVGVRALRTEWRKSKGPRVP